MSDTQKIKFELYSISRYIGLVYAKIAVLLLLAIVYYPMRVAPGYIFIFTLITPLFIELSLSLKENKQTDPVDTFILAPTAKKFHFTVKKYKIEQGTSLLMIVLLLFWQMSIYRNSNFEMPFAVVPSIIIVIYAIVRISVKIFYRFKINHDFLHMNM